MLGGRFLVMGKKTFVQDPKNLGYGNGNEKRGGFYGRRGNIRWRKGYREVEKGLLRLTVIVTRTEKASSVL